MDPSVLLKQRSVRWDDPIEDYAKLRTLRDLMDQRRLREQQFQMHQQAMAIQQRKIDEDDRLQRVLSTNRIPDDASVDQLVKMGVPLKHAMEIVNSQRLLKTAGATAITAELTQRQKEADITQDRLKREANTAAAVTALPPEQRQDWWDTNVGEGIPIDRPPTNPDEQSLFAQAYGGEALQKRRDAEEKAIRDAALYAVDLPKRAAEAKTAQDKAEGKEPLTGNLAYFNNVFWPNWAQNRGLPKNGKTQEAAYLEFMKAGGQPQLLPPDVEAQRIRMAQEAADARAAAAAANAAQKPATEGERKTLGFYERMKNAEEALSTVEETINNLGTTGQIRLKNAPDWAQTKEGQLYHQALRQFTEARLRKESGAVIGPSEFAYSEKTFFPQPNDDPATIKRKKEARALLLNSMRRESGKAYTQTYGEGEPASAEKGNEPNKPTVRWGKDANGKPVRLP